MNVLILQDQVLEIKLTKLLLEKNKQLLLLNKFIDKSTLLQKSLPKIKANGALTIQILQKNAVLAQALNYKLDFLLEQVVAQKQLLLEIDKSILELKFKRRILEKQIQKDQQQFKAKQDKQQYLIIDEWAGRQYQNATN